MADQPGTNLAAPVSQQERIILLDSLRGIAILGILLMNIPGFGLPHAMIDDAQQSFRKRNTATDTMGMANS